MDRFVFSWAFLPLTHHDRACLTTDARRNHSFVVEKITHSSDALPTFGIVSFYLMVESSNRRLGAAPRIRDVVNAHTD